MRLQFIYLRTQSERAVVVEIYEHGDAVIADVDAVEWIRASVPCHEHRRRRRPGVLDVGERATVFIANYEIQIAVAVEVSERGGAVRVDIDAVDRRWRRPSR